MQYAYMKQLIVNGGGKFHVIRIGAGNEEALNVKRDMYLADDWHDATEAEYNEYNAAEEAGEAGETSEE